MRQEWKKEEEKIKTRRENKKELNSENMVKYWYVEEGLLVGGKLLWGQCERSRWVEGGDKNVSTEYMWSIWDGVRC